MALRNNAGNHSGFDTRTRNTASLRLYVGVIEGELHSERSKQFGSQDEPQRSARSRAAGSPKPYLSPE